LDDIEARLLATSTIDYSSVQ